MKSASKIAMNLPVAVFSPFSSAPALNPIRFVTTDVMNVEAFAPQSLAAHSAAISLVPSVESSRIWISRSSFGIADAARRVDKSFDHIHFVVDGKLDGDFRKRLKHSWWHSFLVLVLQVEKDQVISVYAVNCKNRQNCKVGNQDENIEAGKVIQPGEAGRVRRNESGLEVGTVSLPWEVNSPY